MTTIEVTADAADAIALAAMQEAYMDADAEDKYCLLKVIKYFSTREQYNDFCTKLIEGEASKNG